MNFIICKKHDVISASFMKLLDVCSHSVKIPSTELQGRVVRKREGKVEL